LLKQKRTAKAIVQRIDAGEKAVSSLVHLSEVANIVEASMPISDSQLIMQDLIHSPSISILAAAREDYVDAVEVVEAASIGLNDAVVYVLMKANGIEELYSFDKHFDRLKDVRRVHE